MCGIAGLFLPDSDTSCRGVRGWLELMIAAQRHRGPDDFGVMTLPGNRGGIATCRLAIRDLSPAGHMPMTNHDSTVWITYNGEIYNTDELRPALEALGFAFRSNSDTEILLHGYQAWGESMVNRLRGIFAFGILDLPANRLFVGRDRLGVKPLYYTRSGGNFAFASELKALGAAGLLSDEISPGGLAGYLMLGAVPNPLTIYRDARGLEPGHTLTVDLGRLSDATPCRYWQMPTGVRSDIDRVGAVRETRDALIDAVRSQMVSDAPIGAFLSGGIDSSAVVALMRRATGGPIRTCSMAFGEAAYDEAPYARAMAQAAGTEHYERTVTAEDVRRELPRILRVMDQPTVDGVNTYFVAQTARQAGLTVALSGLGGDELFGGYAGTFRGVPRMMRLTRLAQRVPGGATVAGAALAASPRRDRMGKARDALTRPPTAASGYLARRGLFSPSETQELLGAERWQAAIAEFEPLDHIAARAIRNGRDSTFEAQPFAWLSRAELGAYTHHQLLRDTDVMSMAHSLEVRVPLLDSRLVEMVLRLPGPIKAAGLPKSLLLDALGGDLPSQISAPRPKQGFTFPFDLWLRDDLRDTVREMLGAVTARGIVQPKPARAIQSRFDAGSLHWSRLWSLAVLSGPTA